MSNQRASNQTLIAIAVHRKLLQAMDHACTLTGEDRSTFIRQAIVSTVKARNGIVQDEWIRAQVRARGGLRYEPSPLPPPTPQASAVGTKRGAKSRPASADKSPAATRASRR